MSHVMCHVFGDTCQVSRVRCHVSGFFLLFFGQSGGPSQWRVCYQRGLPRLVLMVVENMRPFPFHYLHQTEPCMSYTPPCRCRHLLMVVDKMEPVMLMVVYNMRSIFVMMVDIMCPIIVMLVDNIRRIIVMVVDKTRPIIVMVVTLYSSM